MEALVAVGLAGNVVQFVQFSGKLISEAATIRRRGSPSSLPELRKLAEDLTNQAGTIKTHLGAGSPALSEEDQCLLDVAGGCLESGQEFLTYLDSIIDRNASSNILRSTKSSIRFHWVQRKIDDFATKLDKFRSALTLATILALRASTNDCNDKLLSHLDALERAGEPQVPDDGETLKAIRHLVDIVQNETQAKLDTIQREIQKSLDKIDALRKELPQDRERAILTWLNFRQMALRFEEVPLAYQKTFQWIFEGAPDSAPWDNFTNYLRGADVSTPYFINGKAGSGKSTLMKYVSNHPNTIKALRHWAGNDRVALVHFFFWNLGTTLQKSQAGMLRALLHKILEKCPELIPAVFPTLFHNWKASDANAEPSYTEVVMAFELLIQKSSKFLKLCIMIDGVDEFEGNHRDLAKFLRSLASPRVKLILSSRPLNACLRAFYGCPKLRLQDLTKDDMEIFVEGNLIQHQSMIELTRRFPQEAKELVSEIRTKADGVFLWVKLVVRMLVEGLEDGDNMKDLRNKLRQLPPDLRDLYQRMMAKTQPDYQVQAAEIFQILRMWYSTVIDQPLGTITLSLSLEDPLEAFNRPISEMEMNEFIWRCENMEARLASRCCGLLEVHNVGSLSEIRQKASHVTVKFMGVSIVNYMHRTVAEFLASPDIWKQICDLTRNSMFNPGENLTSGCVSIMTGATELSDFSLVAYPRNALEISGRGNLSDKQLRAYGEAIDQILDYFRCLEECPEYTFHWMRDLYPVTEVISFGRVPVDEHKFHQAGSLFCFAARLGAVEYLRAWRTFPVRHYLFRHALVLHALESWLVEPQVVPRQKRVDTIRFLLENVAQLGDEGFGGSLWQYVLEVCYTLMNDGKEGDCALLLKAAVSTATSTRSLMEEVVETHHGITRCPMVLLDTLQGKDIPGVGDFFEKEEDCDETWI